MQEKILGTITRGENIITLEDMEEEEGSRFRKMWHGTVYKHDKLRGSQKYETSMF